MAMTLDRWMNRIEERVAKNKQDISQKNKQRRTGFVDLYGIEYTRQGDAGSDAKFYISVSLDLVYYERFQFKLYIQPFTSTVESGTESATVTVDNTSLSVSNNNITPNPHRHTTQPHSHNVVSGISLVHTTADDFEILVDDVEITDYLISQHDGDWIDGEGLYPNGSLEEDKGFYDILEVATVMQSEGRDADVEKLLKPGFKEIKIKSNAPFQVTLINYLKYSHLNR